jgi:hypothetical protein
MKKFVPVFAETAAGLYEEDARVEENLRVGGEDARGSELWTWRSVVRIQSVFVMSSPLETSQRVDLLYCRWTDKR